MEKNEGLGAILLELIVYIISPTLHIMKSHLPLIFTREFFIMEVRVNVCRAMALDSVPSELQPINVAYTSLMFGYSSSGEAYIDTTIPNSSHLYKRIVGEGAAIMPPASNDNGSLTPQEVELVYLWIQQGAKNN